MLDGDASVVVENGEGLVSFGGENMEKDPRKIARKYQLELCKKALKENVIVYLGTGCGKTHIAVLLIYELAHLIRRPQMRVSVFLAPTVALVHQQAKVIEDSIDVKVGIFCGSHGHLRSHRDWEKEIEQNEVFVMTPQILLHNLSHSYIKMDNIALLIFDECHHAQVRSSHPYAQIMKVFYKINDGKLPRVFGMTASPVVGKGASSESNLPKSINSLESLLDAKVYSVEDKIELEQFVASPVFKIHKYEANGRCNSYSTYHTKLEEFKRQCLSELGKKIDDDPQSFQNHRNAKKLLRRIHENMIFCLDNLGLWGALQACQILLSDDYFEQTALVETKGDNSDYSVCDRYLSQAQNIFAADCMRDGAMPALSCVEVLKEPFFSRKLSCLIRILTTFRFQPNMKCIVFVNRIVIARSLSYILQNLKILMWECDFLVGIHSGMKSMSRKTMKSILEKFQTGKLNLLVATKVGEEGLDIQTCCLVIRFDLPETVASFIQSRGRARMPQSEYAFLVDSGNQKELDLIENFRKGEDRMNMEISTRTSTESFDNPEERVYRVDETGASVTSGYSISLLHHYCAKLPHDEYFDPKPEFIYFDDIEGTICNITLPSNAPIKQIVSTAQPTNEAAKKDACLKAIEELHKLGALNDFLLPYQEDVDEDDDDTAAAFADFNGLEGTLATEGSRGELHEMLVPAVLKESWADSEDSVCLHSYYIDFCPVPDDRTYKKFGLFIKASLPPDAERMELDLHLARGRHVMTKLSPMGLLEFNGDEILQAQNFQEMFLKAILDRSEIVHQFVPLGTIDFYKSSSTFYLLLPITLYGGKKRLTVDWEIIKRCLSSPLFSRPVIGEDKQVPLDAYLIFADGYQRIRDVENSLIYMPHKNTFYFTTNVIRGKNAYSPWKGSTNQSYLEHLTTTFGIQLKYPTQPLLRAKPLFLLHNLLHDRKKVDSVESQELDEYFDDVAPELCELKIIGFSKDIGSSISLLPSLMHRLENLLVAIELKCLLSTSFPEGSEVTANRVLEAITTEKCQERLSLERLEILGDSFLKFAVSRCLFLSHDGLDEGELTRRRSSAVKNSNLLKLATRKNLQIYIRDQPFDPCQFFVLGRPCPRICTKELEESIHSHYSDHAFDEIRCSKGHHWLHKKTIADFVESLVGAFIVDSGFKAATAFLRWFGIKVDFEASQVINLCQASNSYLPLVPSVDITALENLLEYPFIHRGLLVQAFLHPSYNKHGGGCYQRLEFLGDAVLDFLITSYLFSVYPKLKPGQLTDLRSAMVNNRIFANVAADKSFHRFLICDSRSLSDDIKNYVDFIKLPSSERGQLQGPKCPKVLGDLVESCMGAVILDSGFDLNLAWKTMLSFLDPITDFSNLQLNPIRELQELCQSSEWNLEFEISKKGKSHFVEAKLSRQDAVLPASAININKKEALRIAAEQLCIKLKEKGYIPKFNYLEELLRSSEKMEAVLIGYDETPTDVIVPDATVLKNLKTEEPPAYDFEPKIYCVSKMLKQSSSPGLRGQQTSKITKDPGLDLQNSGGSQRQSAKSRLYELCAANCWKPPTFECCYGGGPGHMMSYVFKVVVETEVPDMILECYSKLQTKKKAAAEQAAEAAIWYLERKGY